MQKTIGVQIVNYVTPCFEVLHKLLVFKIATFFFPFFFSALLHFRGAERIMTSYSLVT